MSPAHREPWDPGLQVERTTLAWLRTSLAFVAGVLLVIRFVAQRSPGLAAFGLAVVLPTALLVAALAGRRYRRAVRSLHAEDALPDGALPAGVTVLAVVVGCCGVAYILLR